jgi:hypothetical protein
MENKKLTEEELKSLQEINARYANVISSLGESELFVYGLQEQLKKAEEEKKGLITDYLSLKEKSDQLSAKLTEKYGSGRIDLQTGIIESV